MDKAKLKSTLTMLGLASAGTIVALVAGYVSLSATAFAEAWLEVLVGSIKED